jgi:hypothetical protein
MPEHVGVENLELINKISTNSLSICWFLANGTTWCSVQPSRLTVPMLYNEGSQLNYPVTGNLGVFVWTYKLSWRQHLIRLNTIKLTLSCEIVFVHLLNENQLDALVILNLFRKKPLHISGVFIAHHQEVKSKAISLQTLTGPEGSRRLRLPDFKTIGTWRW